MSNRRFEWKKLLCMLLVGGEVHTSKYNKGRLHATNVFSLCHFAFNDVEHLL